MAVEMVTQKSRVNPDRVVAFPIDPTVRFTDDEKEMLGLALFRLISGSCVFTCTAVLNERGTPGTPRHSAACDTIRKIDLLIYTDTPVPTLDVVCEAWRKREAHKSGTWISLADIGEIRQAWIGHLIDHC